MSAPNDAPVLLTPVLDPGGDALGALENDASKYSNDDRSAIGSCLGDIIECMQHATSIWQQYADSPSESDVAYTPVMRIGSERARELHKIHLELRDHAKSLTTASKVAFRDTIGISPQVDIIEAYGELAADESGADRARDALTTMQQRIERVEGTANQFK